MNTEVVHVPIAPHLDWDAVRVHALDKQARDFDSDHRLSTTELNFLVIS